MPRKKDKQMSHNVTSFLYEQIIHLIILSLWYDAHDVQFSYSHFNSTKYAHVKFVSAILTS